MNVPPQERTHEDTMSNHAPSDDDPVMLEIHDLHAGIDGTEILSGIDMTVRPGEIHAIMGPNASGKTTFTKVLAGYEAFEVTKGTVTFEGRNLLDLSPEERAREGIFLAFQYPVEIPGVSNGYFLRAALNAVRRHRGDEGLDAMDFLALVKEQMKKLRMNPSLLNRAVNEGFSGGEKKRNEILQLSVLQPKLALLDETDSGLDIDALRVVAEGVNDLRGPDRSVIIVTHYQRLLDYIVPDHVHVLHAGRIVKSGCADLAVQLEKMGYAWIDSDTETSGVATP